MKYVSPPKYLALYAKVFLEPLICVIISVRFKFSCFSLLSIEKTFSCLYFHCLFFYSNARKSCALLIEFLFPMKCSSKKRSSHIAPSPEPHTQTKKIPLITSVHFPVTITVCKHWPKFVTCSPSPRDFGGYVIPKDIVIMVLDYAEQNGYLKILIRWLSLKKWAWEGA